MFAGCRFRIWGFIFQRSHFRFLGAAIVFRLPSLGFRVWGMLDAWVLFCGFRVYSFTCFGFRVSDIVFEHSGFMFQVTGFYILIRNCKFHILHFAICFLHVGFSILGFRFCISSFSAPVSKPRIVGSDFKFAISECILICRCRFHILHFAICF